MSRELILAAAIPGTVGGIVLLLAVLRDIAGPKKARMTRFIPWRNAG